MSQSLPVTPRSIEKAKRFQRPLTKFTQQPAVEFVRDDYEKASGSTNFIRQRTGIIYDKCMLDHKCEWDLQHPECPGRMQVILDRIKELNIDEFLLPIEYDLINEEYLLKLHTSDIIKKVQKYGQMNNLVDQEKEASNYDSIYFNKNTYNSAIVAASCVNALVREVCLQESVTNGVAIVRPPGHHAMKNELNGYCFFNNVALAALAALKEKLANKILIVDFDVHHGQGVQQMFYDEDRVLYFSIHRYEHGKFWPNLRESNFDYIGELCGKGYNINVPLNTTGLCDDDYMAIVLNILLPLAYEFQPELVIFAAGYDSAVGCFEGRMLTSPSFYGQIIKLLSGLARGKLAVVLEGGYFLPSLAEGMARTITALLDFPSEKLKPLNPPHEEVINVINNLRYVLRPYWNCFTAQLSPPMEPHKIEALYLGEPDKAPFPTRGCFLTYNASEIENFTKIVADYIIKHPIVKKRGVCYSYDSEMLQHSSPNLPENSYRLEVLMEKFQKEFNFSERLTLVEPIEITKEMLCKVHTPAYVDGIYKNEFMYEKNRKDIYVTEFTKISALKAVSCLYGVVEAVITDKYDSGVALIRPPGHHAEAEEAGGFCFINNVAVMASYLSEVHNKKVLILDWDIHHGNGTQNIFYKSKDVLYISVHKYEHGKYFPSKPEADFSFIGEGEGKGYNVNIPLNDFRMRNEDYLMLFNRIILPICYSYAPDIILVSAGFDAGVNDRLGNYFLGPEIFGHFVQLLKGLAQSKVIVVLEGGYNPTTVSYSMMMCIKALLGDPLPTLDKFATVFNSVEETIRNVIEAHKKYWPCINLQKMLPTEQLPTPLPVKDVI